MRVSGRAIRTIAFGTVATGVLALTARANADPCGSYPNCNEGSLCEGGTTYVCKKKDNSCGPWSTISGCPNAAVKGHASAATSPGIAGSPTRECLARKGGAVIGFEVNKETFTVWTKNGKFIDEAIALKTSDKSKTPMFKKLLDRRDCDAQWSWHVDPAEMQFVQLATEVCDGRPSDVEKNKAEWLKNIKRYRPWNAKVTSVDDRRSKPPVPSP